MKRQLSELEKREVEKQQLSSDGSLRCFISGLIIQDGSDVEYDHIQAFGNDGETIVSNIRIVLKEYNRRKSDQTLYDVRDNLRLEQLFSDKKNSIRLQDIFNLKDLVKSNTHATLAGQSIAITDGKISSDFSLLFDEILNVHYFYGRIPVLWLENDDQEGLQPRVIDYKRLIALRDHLKVHPQLAPSIGRLLNNRLKLFDGQHKLAAQILNSQQEVDLKIYISPNNMEDSKKLFDNLMITNLEAHSKLKQIPFYTSTLLDRLSVVYKEMLEEFISENAGENHTEENFIRFLTSRKGFSSTAAKDMLRGAVKNAALYGSKLKEFVAEASKDSGFPITVDLLSKSIFKSTLYLEPSSARFTSDTDFRNSETANFAELSSILIEETGINDWVTTSKGKELSSAQRKARRIWHKGAVLTWTPYLKSVLRYALQFMTTAEHETMLFRSMMTEKEKKIIQGCLNRLFSHPMWDDPAPEIDSLLVSARRQDELFNRQGLTERFVLNGTN
jgi:hypothetical protein